MIKEDQYGKVSNRLTQDERVELDQKVYDLVCELDLDFADNYRIVIDEPLDRESYEITKYEGCCGSIDDYEIVLSTGKKILFGCNFGH
jgi:hypothetical protein